MKKIAFLIPDITRCGPVNVAISIMIELYKDHDIFLIAIREENSDKDLIKEISQYLITDPIFISQNRSNSFFGLSKKLENIIIKNSINTIHAHGLIPTIITGLLPSKDVRKITTLHCIPHKDFINEYGILKGSALTVLQYLTLNTLFFDAIVSCSHSVEHGFKGRRIGRNRNRLHVIHNGVNELIFKKIPSDELAALRTELNIPISKKIFVFSGRLCRRKRVPELINIFKEKIEGLNTELYILGEGEEMPLCKSVAGDNKNIHFVGFIQNPEKYYQSADYVISNSSAEGYPLSIIEAMLCGCQALLSPIPAHNEIISHYPNQALSIEDYPTINNKHTTQDLSPLKATNMAQKYARLF